jgi:hypothetical protein
MPDDDAPVARYAAELRFRISTTQLSDMPHEEIAKILRDYADRVEALREPGGERTIKNERGVRIGTSRLSIWRDS